MRRVEDEKIYESIVALRHARMPLLWRRGLADVVRDIKRFGEC